MRDRPHLSVRQFQTLQCVFDGMCNKEIAVKLGVEVRTVKAHKKSLYSKFNISNKWDKDVRLVWLLSGGRAA